MRHGEARRVVLRVEPARARINSLLPACGNKCAFAGRRRRHGPACGDASFGAQRTCLPLRERKRLAYLSSDRIALNSGISRHLAPSSGSEALKPIMYNSLTLYLKRTFALGPKMKVPIFHLLTTSILFEQIVVSLHIPASCSALIGVDSYGKTVSFLCMYLSIYLSIYLHSSPYLGHARTSR